MNKNEILTKIQELLSKNRSDLKIDMSTYLEFNTEQSLDLSSLEIVDFIMEVETIFNIIIDISERFYTVGDVVESVFEHLESENRI